MKELNVEIWLTNPDDDPKWWNYTTATTDMLEYGWFKVGTGLISFEIPTLKQVIPATIEALRKKQTEIRAAAEKQTIELEERIQNLLCLSYEVL